MRALIGKVKSDGGRRASERTKQNENDVEQLLAVSANERSDVDIFRSHLATGTCFWFLKEPDVRDWLDTTSQSRILLV